MKKLLTCILLAGSVLISMPTWSSDRYDEKHHGKKQYSSHYDGKNDRHWKKRWSKYDSYDHDYRHGVRRYKKHHYHPRHYDSFPRHSYYPRHYDNDSHWSVMFRYFE